jgi:phosphonate transport system substrate-binding protein
LLARHDVDLVYANAFDTSWLVRDRGWIPVARPKVRSDEATIAVLRDHPATNIHQLGRPLRVAATEAPDVARIARILLEPAQFGNGDLIVMEQPSYIVVARALLQGKAEIGFFLSSSFAELSDLVRDQLRPLVQSHIYVLRHAMLLAPRHAELREPLLDALLALGADERSQRLAADLDLAGGFEELSPEEALFIADLMETLAD